MAKYIEMEANVNVAFDAEISDGEKKSNKKGLANQENEEQE